MHNYYLKDIDNICLDYYEFEANFSALLKHIVILEDLIFYKDEEQITQNENTLTFDKRAVDIINLYFSGKDPQEELKSYIKDTEKYLFNALKFSKTNNEYFNFCLFEVYENTINERLNQYLSNEYEVNEIDFYKEEYQRTIIDYEVVELSEIFSEETIKTLNKSKVKKLNLLNEKLEKLGVKTVKIKPNRLDKFELKTKIEFINKSSLEIETETKSKSLYYKGKPLNLYERFIIADKLLDIGKKIHTLETSRGKKDELLAYILGCNVDNAKKILNGQHINKKRDLTDLFNELGLNK